jgi:6-phosphogluconolactonase
MTAATCRTTVLLFGALVLSACGGGGGGSLATPPPAPPAGSFSIGGTVTGLASSGLVLQNNGGNDLALQADGSFTFTTQIASGATYAVTVKTQPNVGPAQNCVVANGSGTVGTAAVTNVTVTCTTQVAKFLYVPNTGSNDVSAYTIDATTGALTAVAGSPFPADQRPFISAADPTGKFLVVSNIGPPTLGTPADPARLSVYSINATTGVLTQVAGSPFDLSTPPPPNGTTFIGKPMIHRSGAFGYVGADTGLLYGATINATTGELTEIQGNPFNVGAGLSAGTFNAAGTVLYLPHNTLNGPAMGAIAAFTVNAPSGVLAPLASYSTGGVAPSIAVLSPAGTVLVAPNSGTATVASFRVDTASGTLTAAAGSPFPTGGSMQNVTSARMHPSKNFVYVTNANPQLPSTIAAFQFDATTAVLTPVNNSPFPANGMGALLGSIDPTGKFFYVTNRSSSSIAGFAIDQTTGALAHVPGSPITTELAPSAVAIDPSGKYLYAANSGSHSVSAYSINASTGALTRVNTLPAGQSPSFGELVGLQ